jgi:simple sugar transport system permease protein
MGAMSAYGISTSRARLTQRARRGHLGALWRAHAGICSLPRVNDVIIGIALMLFGTGLAFYPANR